MAHSEYQPRRKRRKPWLGRLLFWSACIVVVLLVAAVMVTPWVLRAAVPEAFARIGLQASVAGGRLNLLRREVTLEDFKLGPPDEPVLSLGELGVGVKLSALLDGRIRIRHLRVKDVSANVEQLLELGKTAGAVPRSATGHLPVELDDLNLEDLRMAGLSERMGQDVRVARLEISNLRALTGSEKKSHVSLEGNVGDGSVELQLDVGLHEGKLQAAGTYRSDALPVRGWARLATGDGDPLSAGAVNGRGDIRIAYSIDARALDLTLDGRVTAEGLGLELGHLDAERGNANWQGRLVVQWSPDMAAPALRGDGSLEVESLHLTFGQSPGSPSRATIEDISWHGDFDWRDGFRSEGTVVGARADVVDASKKEPVWRARAEDFSSRLSARIAEDSDEPDMRVQDFDLARLSVSMSEGGTPVEAHAEKLVVDELHRAQSGGLVLGRATLDTLTINELGAGNAEGVSVTLNSLKASGLIGDAGGTLQVAHLGAESLDYEDPDRRVRADVVDIASIGLGATGRLGADTVTIASARVDEGFGDVWLSGVSARKAHGEQDGGFGAAQVAVEHLFQSGSAELSWEASDLVLHGIEGDVHDAASIDAIELGALEAGIGTSSWEGTGLRVDRLAVTMSGDLTTARVGFERLDRRQAATGDVSISKLEGRGFRRHDSGVVLDSLEAASLEYRSPDGAEYTTRTLEAHALTGDASKGLEVGKLSVANASGHDLAGTNSSATALEGRGLSVTIGGRLALDNARLESFSRTASDSSALGLDRLVVASLGWAPGDPLSTVNTTLHAARFVRPDGVSWAVSDLETSNFVWNGQAGISADRVALTSVSQSHEGMRDWRVLSLRGTGIEFDLPDDVAVTTVAAGSVDGGTDSQAWTVESVDVEGFSSTANDGQKVDRIASGAVEVKDQGNGAVLNLERTAAEAVEVNVLEELSARRLNVVSLRLGSDRPDWPSRLSMSELRLENPALHSGGIVDLGDVVMLKPYFVLAETGDNVWMWPPFPGVGNGDAKAAPEGGPKGGLRLAHFTTRGPGRFVFIDRGTKPVLQLAVDPMAVAIENLDTTLPGNRSRFRARGTSSRFADATLDGDFITGVHGFDLELEFAVTGAFLPELNPSLAKHEPIAATTGWGDIDGELEIENNQLRGVVNVLLSGLRIEVISDNTTRSIVNPANLPIRTALGWLKDRHGNVSLTVPLNAQTEDPDYDAIDSLSVAFVGAVTNAGRVAGRLGGKTLQGALRLLESTVSVLPGVGADRYPPIEFPPGGDNFTAIPLVFLDQLGNRMFDHEELVVALCGRSVSEESRVLTQRGSGIDALFAKASEGVYRTYEPDRSGLLALAAARADAVRRYLRDVDGVQDRQLVSCDPEIDTAPGAMPRVEIRVESRARRRGLFGLSL